jgi:hypothetical protein
MFESVTAFHYKLWNRTEVGEAEGSVACALLPNSLKSLEPGRTFLEEEGPFGRDQVVFINYRYWTGRFAADPNVIGRTLNLNGRNYTVVGILPADLQYPAAPFLDSPGGRAGLRSVFWAL